MTEEAYRRVTFDITLAAAQTLARSSPAMTFIYVSGAGTDSSELGRRMWARVKGQTENALLRLPLKGSRNVPAGRHRATARRYLEDTALPHPLRADATAVVCASQQWVENDGSRQL